MTELSPAAQAVFDAINKELDEAPWDLTFIAGSAAAAALRAAAELLSKEVDAPKVDGSKYNGIWHSFDCLNAIADELEAL